MSDAVLQSQRASSYFADPDDIDLDSVALLDISVKPLRVNSESIPFTCLVPHTETQLGLA